MRVVGSRSTATSRQISEAVRIRRRGGEGRILNSRSEYNRSHIPRLQVEEEELTKKREEEMKRLGAIQNKEMDTEQLQWEQGKLQNIKKDRRELVEHLNKGGIITGGGKKRNKGEKIGGRSKRRKYALLKGDWGAPVPVGVAPRGEKELSQGATIEGGGEHQNPPSSLHRKPVEGVPDSCQASRNKQIRFSTT